MNIIHPYKLGRTMIPRFGECAQLRGPSAACNYPDLTSSAMARINLFAASLTSNTFIPVSTSRAAAAKAANCNQQNMEHGNHNHYHYYKKTNLTRCSCTNRMGYGV